jgi:streptogrisin C
MRKFVLRAAHGLLLTVPLTLLLAMTAAAAGPAEDVSPSVRQALQRDLGLTPAQVSHYLKVERLAQQQEKALAVAQGRHYAGSWIERQGNGHHKLVVASTRGAQKSALGDVEIRGARHTLAALEAAKASLDGLLARGLGVPKGVHGWHVDVQTNSVVVNVGVGGQQAAIEFVAASGADVDTVRFVVDAEAPSLRMGIKGGFGVLRNPGDGYLHACSIGFTVMRGTTPGYVTAGHCGKVGQVVYYEPYKWSLGTRLGSFYASRFPAPGQSGYDYAWVKVDSGHTLLPTVYGWGKVADVTVRGLTAAPVGAAVCRSGRTTTWRCGTILGKGKTVSYSSGEIVLNLTATTACSEGGDSGGSFITGPGQAQGVLSGGSGSCTSTGARSFFQPLWPILSAYGLTLRTGS